jgi:hypothetical protein
MKYVSLGRAANEKMLIAESQEAMRMIHLTVPISNREKLWQPNDVLLIHGQFEKKGFMEGTPSRKEVDSFGAAVRGLKAYEATMGKLQVQYFVAEDKNLKSFLKGQRIGIFLFSKSILFVRQEKENKFRVRFVCRACEVHWDFSREYGTDSFMMWAPFGQLLLKVDPGKGSAADFEKTQWKQNVEKFGVINEGEENTGDDTEKCFVSWVGMGLPTVVFREFIVKCRTKTEAVEKIKKTLDELEVQVETKANPLGTRDPLINVEFQTYRRSQNQKSDVISDVELK